MSTDCCTYNCTQGRDCPVRATPCDNTCTPLITKQGGATVTCCHAEPTEQQDQPLSVWESIFFWGCITLASAGSVAVLAGIAGYLWGAVAA